MGKISIPPSTYKYFKNGGDPNRTTHVQGLIAENDIAESLLWSKFINTTKQNEEGKKNHKKKKNNNENKSNQHPVEEASCHPPIPSMYSKNVII